MSSANNRKVFIERKEKKLKAISERILILDDTIKKAGSDLKEKRQGEKSTTVSKSRIVSHNKSLEIDHLKRPSDQYYDIRNYSKMDQDLWKYPQMCGWFNKNATEAPAYNLSPSDTGYCVKI